MSALEIVRLLEVIMNLFKLEHKTKRYKGYIIDCYRRTPSNLLWHIYGINKAFTTLKKAKEYIDINN